MKTLRSCWRGGKFLILPLLILACETKVFAQTPVFNTNLPPVVTISSPTNGEVFFTPTNILILAKAGEPDGSVTNVEFFAAGGPVPIGSGTPVVLDPPGVNGVTGLVYLFNWRNPPSVGAFPLTAVATDNYGLSTTSAPVNISVLQGPRVVRIYRPTNGETFFGPVDVPIYATASASNGIASVEFFADGRDLGPGVLDGCVTTPPAVPICFYSLVWSNAPVGNHVLSAVISDNNNLSTASLPVNITVLQGPPPTNGPPAVVIDSPTNGATFFVPADVRISADVSASNGIASVEFFADDQDLGPGILSGCTLPNPISTCTYYLVWSNAPVGNHILTAIAADNDGLSTTSAPVNITVLQGPPSVRINSPTNAQTFYGSIICPPCVTNNPPCELPCYFEGPDIPVYATAYASASPTNPIASVEFFADGQDLGPGALQGCVMPAITCVGCPPPVMTCTYYLVWNNAPLGNHILTAIAIDNNGLSSTSAPVKISVMNGPPPTNLPPVVRIVSPANGSVFHAPINLPIYAYATDPAGFVASVQFFAGTNDLGLGQRVPVITPLADGTLVVGGPVPPIYPTNLFFLVWSNAPAGDYPLTAVATDNGGLSATSAPVNITILSPLPPPTNRPPIVTIVATDPVAIEGTNSWIWWGETNALPTWAAWPTAVCRLFTNYGPKTATFTMRRFGDTNYDLTVSFDIGGTASNGVDYVALPGYVNIPAGDRRALITIIPIDDGPPDLRKTVMLTLLPDLRMNPLPGYVLGFPRRAAAIILDRGPCPVTGMLFGHYFHLKETGPNAAWFCIEYSTNLVNWTPVCTNQVINGSIDFVDPDAATNPSRFYRAVPLTNPPSD